MDNKRDPRGGVVGEALYMRGTSLDPCDSIDGKGRGPPRVTSRRWSACTMVNNNRELVYECI